LYHKHRKDLKTIEQLFKYLDHYTTRNIWFKKKGMSRI